MRTDERDGIPLIVSDLIPDTFRHGFTTRHGGVSAAPFDTFNLGRRFGDVDGDIAENRRRLQLRMGATSLHLVNQVHGAEVLRVRAGDDPSQAPRPEADALVTDAPGEGLAVFVADCVPILLADPRTGACAAVHAGWRGVLAQVVPAALREMLASGTEAGEVFVALGPCISGCCFEVGPEVVAAFDAKLPAARAAGAISDRPAGKAYIDLRMALRAQLAAVGVVPDRIDADRTCTRCDPARRFFSYRRDAQRTGQQVGFIVRAR